MFDAVRLDHFIGFQRYWEIPASCPTAVEGRWAEGPGSDLFDALQRELGSMPVIAEDLGAVTPEVIALRDRYGFPGMRVLQFAFGGDPSLNDHLPHRYPFSCVVYTGTHDNDTTRGWYRALCVRAEAGDAEAVRERAFLRRYLGARAGRDPLGPGAAGLSLDRGSGDHSRAGSAGDRPGGKNEPAVDRHRELGVAHGGVGPR